MNIEKTTYTIDAECINCGKKERNLQIPFGIKIRDFLECTPCSACGCCSLHKTVRSGIRWGNHEGNYSFKLKVA